MLNLRRRFVEYAEGLRLPPSIGLVIRYHSEISPIGMFQLKFKIWASFAVHAELFFSETDPDLSISEDSTAGPQNVKMEWGGGFPKKIQYKT